MKNLLTRSATAIIYGLILIACVISGKTLFLGFFGILSIVCLLEFYSLAQSQGIYINKVGGTIFGILLYSCTAGYYLGLLHLKFFFFLLPFFYLIFIQELFNKRPRPFFNIAFTLLGPLYTVFPFILFISISFITTNNGHYDYHYSLGFLFLLWANDTGAFFAGKIFGNHRLLERISPKKTWEGLGGGLMLCLGVALLLTKYYKQLNIIEWFLMAIIIVIMGTLGDLIESMFKREIEAKDSGNILPGHGGVLDRFDGLLLSAPFVFLYLLLVH